MYKQSLIQTHHGTSCSTLQLKGRLEFRLQYFFDRLFHCRQILVRTPSGLSSIPQSYKYFWEEEEVRPHFIRFICLLPRYPMLDFQRIKNIMGYKEDLAALIAYGDVSLNELWL